MRSLPSVAASCSGSRTICSTAAPRRSNLFATCRICSPAKPRAVRGVGRALINGVYEQAKAAGCRRVYWQTHETNHTAMQLYDKLAERSGFVVYRKLF